MGPPVPDSLFGMDNLDQILSMMNSGGLGLFAYMVWQEMRKMRETVTSLATDIARSHGVLLDRVTRHQEK